MPERRVGERVAWMKKLGVDLVESYSYRRHAVTSVSDENFHRGPGTFSIQGCTQVYRFTARLVKKKKIYVDTVHFSKRVDLLSASLIVKNWVGYPVLYNTHASCMGGRRRQGGKRIHGAA